ncbi:MAG: hypothetical protein IJB56_01255 [Alistipes sp.]|nr:hypothetical protein [Alistipes sp.]
MKRLMLLVLLALMTIPAAEAKRRETPEEIERKTRHYSGWEWGATGRLGLVFYELDYMRIVGEKPMRAYKSQAKMGGNVMLTGGYLINNHWRVGFEAGAQIQYNYTTVPIAVTAHYFYGKRKNCLFNFVNMGTNVLFDKGLRFGTTFSGGIGYRLQAPGGDMKYDITLGYNALMMNPRPVIKEPFGYALKDVNRKAFNQMVFVGFGINF